MPVDCRRTKSRLSSHRPWRLESRPYLALCNYRNTDNETLYRLVHLMQTGTATLRGTRTSAAGRAVQKALTTRRIDHDQFPHSKRRREQYLLSRGRFKDSAKHSVAPWFSNLLAHVPQSHSTSSRPLSCDRPRPARIRLFRCP